MVNIKERFNQLKSWRLTDLPMFKAGYITAIEDIVKLAENTRSKEFKHLDCYVNQRTLLEILDANK